MSGRHPRSTNERFNFADLFTQEASGLGIVSLGDSSHPKWNQWDGGRSQDPEQRFPKPLRH